MRQRQQHQQQVAHSQAQATNLAISTVITSVEEEMNKRLEKINSMLQNTFETTITSLEERLFSEVDSLNEKLLQSEEQRNNLRNKDKQEVDKKNNMEKKKFEQGTSF
jgi:hypothetical protein